MGRISHENSIGWSKWLPPGSERAEYQQTAGACLFHLGWKRHWPGMWIFGLLHVASFYLWIPIGRELLVRGVAMMPTCGTWAKQVSVRRVPGSWSKQITTTGSSLLFLMTEELRPFVAWIRSVSKTLLWPASITSYPASQCWTRCLNFYTFVKFPNVIASRKLELTNYMYTVYLNN